MNLKTFLKNNWPHFAAVLFLVILSAVFFKAQFDGLALDQHDVKEWKGMSNETKQFTDETGTDPLWTGSMFGGMPTTQIYQGYSGNWFRRLTDGFFRIFNEPFGIVLIHLIGFYILGIFLRLRPLVAIIGAVAVSFASYEIIILQAGHVSKAVSIAFLAPALGAFIYAFKTNRMWGIIWTAFFMAFQIAANHLQITYYFSYLLAGLGIYFLIDAIRTKKIKDFAITSGGILIAMIIAFCVNIGNVVMTADYAKETIRGTNDVTIEPNGLTAKNQSNGLERDYITNWSYGIGETFTLISPNVKGGGSFPLGGSQFEDIVDNSSFSSKEKSEMKRFGAYWGEQPITSGPVYIGVIVMLLAFLGLIFIRSGIKWPLFIITILGIMLSWGKNFAGLTDFFIDSVPGYDKFRTVTMILILVELTVALLGVYFLNELINQREEIKKSKNKLFIALGAFTVFLFILKFVGIGDHFTSESDEKQLVSIEANFRKQIASSDPNTMSTQYGLDINNRTQVDAFVSEQLKQYEEGFSNLRVIREDIYNASLTRSILFAIFASIFIIVFVFVSSIPQFVFSAGMLLLVIIDLLPVANQYIGDPEKYWVERELKEYPISASQADEEIIKLEIAERPELSAIIEKGKSEGIQLAEDLDYTGAARNNVINTKRFYALNKATNFRVFDLNGGFSSSKASYFHKSLGGYHGAKLMTINNLFNFHISKNNEKVLDMLNVKYFLQSTEAGDRAIPRPGAMGNAWLVKSIETYDNANDEIRALSQKYTIEKKGEGQLLVNGEPIQSASVYGLEDIVYVSNIDDTLPIRLYSSLKQNESAVYVADANGAVNQIPKITLERDSLNSFKQLVEYTVDNEFKPNEEAIMLTSEAEKLSKKAFTGEGKVDFISYAPNHLVYQADLKGDQLIVFSELYYKDGWKAFIDGKEADILKTNYLLRGLEVKSGKHKIEFKFDLPKYTTSNLIAGFASLLIFLSVVLGIYIQFRKNKERSLINE